MRIRIADFGLMVLAVVVLIGCQGESRHDEREDRTDVRSVMEVQMTYLAACRALVGELRQQFGESGIIHDIWPDIQQASVRAWSPSRSGRVILVTISATGPDRCRAEVFIPARWRFTLHPLVRRAFGDPSETAKP